MLRRTMSSGRKAFGAVVVRSLSHPVATHCSRGDGSAHFCPSLRRAMGGGFGVDCNFCLTTKETYTLTCVVFTPLGEAPRGKQISFVRTNACFPRRRC